MKFLVFEEKGKPENPEKKLSELRRRPITNSTHIPGGATPHDGLYGVGPPKRATFFRLQVYKRVGISLVEVYKRVGQFVV